MNGNMLKSLVVGLGETGGQLYRILLEKYGTDNVRCYDADEDKVKVLFSKEEDVPIAKVDILHICFPYSADFDFEVNNYIKLSEASITVIHSTVPVGVTEKIHKAMHSPIRGVHNSMYKALKTYVKYLSYNEPYYSDAETVREYFENAGIVTVLVKKTRTTELMKLLELCRYGVYIAFAKEQGNICKAYGLDYEEVVKHYEITRNDGIDLMGTPELKQPILYPFDKFVGGHCTVEDMEIMLNCCPTSSKLLKTAYDIDRGTAIWPNSNIYPTAKIGKGCSIGQFCEIGEKVVIGNNVRIGAYTFIPEGVTIEDDVFIAPRVSFSNDKHPPSKKEFWGKILIKEGAIIGMGAIILPGVTVGKKALVGAGSVVTKDVPDNEVWYGVAAFRHGVK